MRPLFDQNLARRLVHDVAESCPSSLHVVDANLDTADDRTIWEFAKAAGYVIVSKDSDFRQLAFLYGHPPKTIWLRIGNSPTRIAAEVLRTSEAAMIAFVADADLALLVLPAVE